MFLSCGKKTAPVPPQTVIPAPVTDLEFQLDEDGASLSWSRPDLTDIGSRLRKISEFIVEKAEYPNDKACRDCPLRYKTIATVEVPNGTSNQDRFRFRDEDLKADYFYSYRILVSLGWRVTSRPSPPISFTWQTPIKSPLNLEAHAGDQQITLNWQAPDNDINNEIVKEALQYQIFRSIGGRDFLPLGKPVNSLYFTDTEVINESGYRYRLRAARITGGSGVFSNIAEAVPRDLTAPLPPEGLEGINVSDGIRLLWEASTAKDIAGYMVFRHNQPDFTTEEIQAVAEVKAPATTFIDTSSSIRDGIWYYAIKAFDKATPPNKSPFSRIIEINSKR